MPEPVPNRTGAAERAGGGGAPRSRGAAVRTLPNLLSLLRLLLAALLPFAPEAWWAAMVAAAAASDGLDGWIARRYGATTWYGGLLDAGADKAFSLTALAVVVADGRLALWMLGPLLARDATVLAIVAYAALRREWWAFRSMPSRPFGKVTTVALFALLLLVILWPEARPAKLALFAAAAATSVAAAVDYVVAFGRMLRSR